MSGFQAKSKGRIAVVGGGVSGIGCLWGLRGTEHEVHLYDADTQLGGHAHTNTIQKNGSGYWLYCNAGRLLPYVAIDLSHLPHLGVATIPTDMSTSVTEEDGPMASGNTSLWSFIGGPRFFSPWFWRFMFDILRFNFCATEISAEKSNKSQHDKTRDNERLESIGEYLERKGYSDQFKQPGTP